MKKLSELLAEVLAEIGGEQGVQDEIKRQKLELIDCLMRGYKIAQIFDNKCKIAISPENIGDTFYRLYDLDLCVLEDHLLALDKAITRYMKREVLASNLGVGSGVNVAYNLNYN